jgi:hypothetical protein
VLAAGTESQAGLPEAVREELHRLCRRWNDEAEVLYDQQRRRGNRHIKPPPRLSPEIADQAAEQLHCWDYRRTRRSLRLAPSWGWAGFGRLLRPLTTHPELQLVHLVRLLVMLGEIDPASCSRYQLSRTIGAGFDQQVRRYRAAHPPGFDLRELAAAFTTVGLDHLCLGWDYLLCGKKDRFGLPVAATGRYLTEQTGILEQLLGVADLTVTVDRRRLRQGARIGLKVIAELDHTPAELVEPLWRLALGRSQEEQRLAQVALDRLPESRARVIAALSHSRGPVRASAAAWLGHSNDSGSVAHMRSALTKERSPQVRSVLLASLESLGVELDGLIDLDALHEEAEQCQAKGLPVRLAWLRPEQLPEVRWAESGELVAPVLVSWIVIHAYRYRSPQPSPWLRHLGSRFDRERAAALGEAVLGAWIGQDTATFTAEEVSDQVRIEARRALPHHPDRSEEQLFEELLDQRLRRCRGTAIGEKGVLALAAVCGGAGVVTAAADYLETWQGSRSAQCKALLQMLVWIDEPAAGQLLKEIADGAGSAAVRREAIRCLEARRDGEGA